MWGEMSGGRGLTLEDRRGRGAWGVTSGDMGHPGGRQGRGCVGRDVGARGLTLGGAEETHFALPHPHMQCAFAASPDLGNGLD